jgi:hypothetical protein
MSAVVLRLYAPARARADLAAAFGLSPHGLDSLLLAPSAVREPILSRIYAEAERVLADNPGALSRGDDVSSRRQSKR